MNIIKWMTEDHNIAILLITNLLSNAIRSFLFTFDETVVTPSVSRIPFLSKKRHPYEWSKFIGGIIVMIINVFIAYLFSKVFLKRKSPNLFI